MSTRLPVRRRSCLSSLGGMATIAKPPARLSIVLVGLPQNVLHASRGKPSASMVALWAATNSACSRLHLRSMSRRTALGTCTALWFVESGPGASGTAAWTWRCMEAFLPAKFVCWMGANTQKVEASP
jgi:hypothetical protein